MFGLHGDARRAARSTMKLATAITLVLVLNAQGPPMANTAQLQFIIENIAPNRFCDGNFNANARNARCNAQQCAANTPDIPEYCILRHLAADAVQNSIVESNLQRATAVTLRPGGMGIQPNVHNDQIIQGTFFDFRVTFASSSQVAAFDTARRSNVGGRTFDQTLQTKFEDGLLTYGYDRYIIRPTSAPDVAQGTEAPSRYCYAGQGRSCTVNACECPPANFGDAGPMVKHTLKTKVGTGTAARKVTCYACSTDAGKFTVEASAANKQNDMLIPVVGGVAGACLFYLLYSNLCAATEDPEELYKRSPTINLMDDDVPDLDNAPDLEGGETTTQNDGAADLIAQALNRANTIIDAKKTQETVANIEAAGMPGEESDSTEVSEISSTISASTGSSGNDSEQGPGEL